MLSFGIEVNAQRTLYTASGVVNFEIKLRGKHPDFDKIRIISAHGALLNAKLFDAKPLNDSILRVSCYNFGPTVIVMKILDKNFYTAILPEQKDTLIINFSDSIHYTLDYKGYFKDIFEFSNNLGEVISQASAYSNVFFDKRIGYKFFDNSNDFKNSRLERVDSILLKFGNKYLSSIVNKHVNLHLEMYYKRLMINFPLVISKVNRAVDSVRAKKIIPNSDLTYYNDIVDKKFGDTTSLLSFQHYDFIYDLLKDSLLKLPSLKAGPKTYHNALKSAFGQIFGQGENLFYDLALANAYLSQINEGNLLTDAQISDVNSFFKNPEISKFILYENREQARVYAKAVNKIYLPFEKTNNDVMPSILEKYKGKIMLIDFWATWCGPCIAGFDEFSKVKEHFKENKDVVFIYITDQTSNYAEWNNYVKKLRGEHFYLYNKQSNVISEKYGFNSIPTYLVFDKQGRLTHKSIGLKGDEKYKAIEWIETAFKK